VSDTGVSFSHLLRLSDETGLLEHACGATPRRGYGYCVDDAARGLVVICREPEPDDALAKLAETYLALLAHAQAPDGRCRNRLSYDRRWEDEPGLGDWWGRALWGWGTAAARSADPWVRDDALECFERSAHRRSAHPRTMAFATLGAAEVLARNPSHPAALGIAAGYAEMFCGSPTSERRSEPPSAAWPWPEPRLTYANALLPEALVAAGVALADDRLLARGLDLLGWLLDIETLDGHLSVTPVGGWGPGEPRPGFDQQAIEAAAIADACARAFAVTHDPRWPAGVDRALGWFLGDNDAGVPMCDPGTGGGYDGLSANRANSNQGAESTLALIATLQQSRRLAASIT